MIQVSPDGRAERAATGLVVPQWSHRVRIRRAPPNRRERACQGRDPNPKCLQATLVASPRNQIIGYPPETSEVPPASGVFFVLKRVPTNLDQTLNPQSALAFLLSAAVTAKLLLPGSARIWQPGRMSSPGPTELSYCPASPRRSTRSAFRPRIGPACRRASRGDSGRAASSFVSSAASRPRRTACAGAS
jgi:hypothetical protein